MATTTKTLATVTYHKTLGGSWTSLPMSLESARRKVTLASSLRCYTSALVNVVTLTFGR